MNGRTIVGKYLFCSFQWTEKGRYSKYLRDEGIWMPGFEPRTYYRPLLGPNH